MSEQNRTSDRGATGTMPILSYEETAALMGLSPRYVEKIEKQALKKLRRQLAKLGLNRIDCQSKEPRVRVA